jgi:NAD-dependent dihydropyrimidine dehydrogenase PreA subunit
MVNDKAVVDIDACVDCGVCVDACPAEAITME